jgi:predicted lysophospholipase L1 biosynthesis ABC-type transport system permease subunit
MARALPDDPELLDSLVRSDIGIGSPVLVSCADAPALGSERCDGGATVLDMNGDDVESTGVTHAISAGGFTDLPVVTVAAVTDGRVTTIERVRTRLEVGLPGTHPITRRDIDAENNKELDTMQRISNIGLSVTLVIAGCSLAVAVAGAIVERRQAFALLRLAGTRLSDLRRVVLAEAATPLLMVAAVSAALGVTVAYLILTAAGAGRDFAMPGATYWLALVGGLALALLVVLATLPLLSRLTALDSARFE